MAEKKKLNGWYRLWIVYAILPTMFFGIFIYNEGLYGIDYTEIYVYRSTPKETEVYKLALRRMQNGAPENVLQETLKRNSFQYSEFKRYVDEKVDSKNDRRKMWTSLWLGLTFLPLAIGHAIAWIIKGFKE